MKKRITLMLIVVVSVLGYSPSAFAQKEYAKGDVLINVGLGGSYYFAGGTPIIGSVEFAINDLISIGPYLGFTSWSYRYSSYRSNYTFIDFGGRGSYHFSKHLNLNTDKLDLYAGAMLGYVASSYSDNSGLSTYVDPYGSGVRFGALGGARWYFSPGFAANAEVAVGGITPAMIGLTFKL